MFCNPEVARSTRMTTNARTQYHFNGNLGVFRRNPVTFAAWTEPTPAASAIFKSTRAGQSTSRASKDRRRIPSLSRQRSSAKCLSWRRARARSRPNRLQTISGLRHRQPRERVRHRSTAVFRERFYRKPQVRCVLKTLLGWLVRQANAEWAARTSAHAAFWRPHGSAHHTAGVHHLRQEVNSDVVT